MCNEQERKQTEQTELYDYRFFDYRLTQLEQEIQKGLSKLEQEYNTQNKQVMKLLTALQENNNEQNRTLVELTQKQKHIEDKIRCVDKLREVATKNHTMIMELERRVDIYKQLLFVIGTGVVIALIKAFVFNI